ncbi:MAG: toluene-4-monooxygenase system B family protein [Deltaproteobacteria bacterium]|nr:toluene-4-monooxygenase system B family protein [Deltaproteobacteria bacterium]
MAAFALCCGFDGDYGFKVLLVDDGFTIAQVAQEAARQLAGVVVRPLEPGEKLTVCVQGNPTPLAPEATIKSAGLMEMETIFVHRQAR